MSVKQVSLDLIIFPAPSACPQHLCSNTNSFQKIEKFLMPAFFSFSLTIKFNENSFVSKAKLFTTDVYQSFVKERKSS